MILFKQSRGLNTRKFTLLDDKILVETRSLRKNQKYELPLDRVGNEIYYQSDSTILSKIFFIVFVSIPVILIIITSINHEIEANTIVVNCMIWWSLALLNYLKQHEDDIYLTGGEKDLIFYRDIPSEEKVLEFVNQINDAAKKYLRESYTNVDITIPEDVFLGRLHWLKDKKIITDVEFYELKAEYEIKKLL